MRQSPANHIEKTAISAWRWTAVLFLIIPLILVIGSVVTYIFFSWPWWLIAITALLFVIDLVLSVIVVPMLRWRRWRYEVFEQEIYIQHGILIRSRTIIPMLRVQHVDTKQGPILKRFSLATVTVSTAATTHEIPALSDEEASDLRDRISELARVDEDDV
ncbi:PH domain-containing protein [Salimicrobium sp. PL1-032A]|uniref:PH domain-containing protein n=1 Tax=Salimicrobium sp. PL1-032A TaxID=3095364 RepID=UPI0032603070